MRINHNISNDNHTKEDKLTPDQELLLRLIAEQGPQDRRKLVSPTDKVRSEYNLDILDDSGMISMTGNGWVSTAKGRAYLIKNKIVAAE